MEKKGLLISVYGNVLIGVIGLVVALLSDSQAILLDGLFNLTYVGAGLFTLKVADLVMRGDTSRYPMGYGYYEPLINGIKGLMVLGVSVMALIGSIEAIIAGGRQISPGLATFYGIFATLACAILAIVTRRSAKCSRSPLVEADARNWLVNGVISGAVLLAFVSIFLIRDTRYNWMIPYVDPVLVLLVVLFSISVPIRMAWQALMELLNRAPASHLFDQVESTIHDCLRELPVQEIFVRMIQPGRTRMVLAHVILPPDFSPQTLAQLDHIRDLTHARLTKLHPDTFVDLVFTSQRKWGAPASDE